MCLDNLIVFTDRLNTRIIQIPPPYKAVEMLQTETGDRMRPEPGNTMPRYSSSF